MRYLISAFIFLFNLGEIEAQYQLLNQAENNVSIEISLINNVCNLHAFVPDSGPGLLGVNVSLENGDLVIEYQPRNTNRDQNYKVYLEADINGDALFIFKEDLIGAINQEIQTSNGQQNTIIWTRLFERYINLEGTLTLHFKTELWGTPKLPYGIECGKPPVFGGKQRLPNVIAAGVGLASIGASLIFERKSNDIYENDYLTQNFEDQAEPFYQQANDDHQKGLILRYTGTAILALDAIWYVYRTIRHKKKLKAYNESCRDNSAIQIRPLIHIQTSSTAPSQLGFSLTYQFGR